MKQFKSAKKNFVIVITLVLLISIITWLYPYSNLSVYKSYTYDKGLVLKSGITKQIQQHSDVTNIKSTTYDKGLDIINGKTHEQIVQQFKERFEVDLKEIEQNRTVYYTQYILPLFEQDWYLKEEAVTIKKQDLEPMLIQVKNTRSTLLSLLQHEEYTSEQKMYLVQLIESFLGMEEKIRFIQHESFLSRSDIHRLLENLRSEQSLLFSIFTTFYNFVVTNE